MQRSHIRRKLYRLSACLLLFASCGREPSSQEESLSPPAGGGRGVVRVAVPHDPRTFNPLLVTDVVSDMLVEQLHAPLLKLNQQTQQVEGALAASWSFSQSGEELIVKLREGLRFSDGARLTAEDVVFTFEALHHPEVASPLSESAQVEGHPLRAEAIDPSTVRFRLPRRTAVTERLFDSIGILPRHLLAASLEEGDFAAAFGPGVVPSRLVGLGPFKLKDYAPGQRVVLERNPHYWRSGGSAADRFPKLDGLVFEIISDPSARVLRLQAGEVDLVTGLGPESCESLVGSNAGELRVKESDRIRASSERLWFNLNPASPISAAKRSWFEDVRFRQAVSLAIDRAEMARVVWSKRASASRGPVSQANRRWVNEAIEIPAMDLDKARELLKDAGFKWNEAGELLGPSSEAVRIELLTTAANPHRLRMASFLQQDLGRIGIDLRLVPIEGPSLFARITSSFDYDACLLGLSQTDPDPSAEMALWMSRAPLHLWHPSQESPATAWEARLDALMEGQMVEFDPSRRKALYDEAQALIVEQLPVLDLVVPHVLLGFHRRVEHLKPTPFGHPMWNSDELTAGPLEPGT